MGTQRTIRTYLTITELDVTLLRNEGMKGKLYKL